MTPPRSLLDRWRVRAFVALSRLADRVAPPVPALDVVDALGLAPAADLTATPEAGGDALDRASGESLERQALSADGPLEPVERAAWDRPVTRRVLTGMGVLLAREFGTPKVKHGLRKSDCPVVAAALVDMYRSNPMAYRIGAIGDVVKTAPRALGEAMLQYTLATWADTVTEATWSETQLLDMLADRLDAIDPGIMRGYAPQILDRFLPLALEGSTDSYLSRTALQQFVVNHGGLRPIRLALAADRYDAPERALRNALSDARLAKRLAAALAHPGTPDHAEALSLLAVACERLTPPTEARYDAQEGFTALTQLALTHLPREAVQAAMVRWVDKAPWLVGRMVYNAPEGLLANADMAIMRGLMRAPDTETRLAATRIAAFVRTDEPVPTDAPDAAVAPAPPVTPAASVSGPRRPTRA